MKKLYNIFFILVLSVSVCFLNGCGGADRYNIFNNSDEKNLNDKSCYMEEEDEVYNNGKLESSDKTKSWYDSSEKRTRIETYDSKTGKTIFIYDGHKKMISYNEKSNEVLIIENSGSDDGADYNIGAPAPATNMLDNLRSTHNIIMGKEEYVNGFKTYNVIVKPKNSSENESTYYFWIDQASQIIIKSDIKSSLNDTDFEFESKSTCTKIDYSYKMTDDLFNFKIPSGAKVEKLSTLLQYKNVTLNEASEKLGKSVLYYNSSKALKLKKVRLMSSGMKDDIPVIDMDYYKNNIPYFTVNAMRKISPDSDYTNNTKKETDFINKWRLNVIDDSEIKMIEWEDNGIQYTIYPIDPSISIKDLEKIIGSMIYES